MMINFQNQIKTKNLKENSKNYNNNNNNNNNSSEKFNKNVNT